jgi:predicted transcriptional regulator
MGPAVAVREDATLREVARMMLECHVDSVLVVNSHAEVVGIVTQRQLTLDERYLRIASVEVPEIGGRAVTGVDEVDAACVAALRLTAKDVMEKRLISACVEERVGEVVQRMLRRDAGYAIVQQGGSVVGMLGSHDMLRKIAGEPSRAHLACTLSVDGQPVRFSNGHERASSVIGWLAGAWR